MATVYFDNSATTFPKPELVYSAMKETMKYGVNADRGGYDLARKTGEIIFNTRTSLAQLVNANDYRDIVLLPSATVALNTILFGLDWANGDNVYLSPFEHNGVLRPLYELQKRYNIQVRDMKVDRVTFEYDLIEMESLFKKAKPKLVVLNHGSNVCGVITPVEQIGALAKRYGALVLVDAAQTIGTFDINVQTQNIDFLVFAGHKNLCGPIGIGGFVSNSQVRLKPLIFGGTGVESESKNMPRSYPERLEAGSPNVIAISGLLAGLQYVNANPNIRKQEGVLFDMLLEELTKHPEINIYASPNDKQRLPIVSCTIAGYTPREFANVLDQHFNIAVRSGLHCAPKSHQFLGTAPLGTVRFSLGPSNTQNDIQVVSQALESIFF